MIDYAHGHGTLGSYFFWPCLILFALLLVIGILIAVFIAEDAGDRGLVAFVTFMLAVCPLAGTLVFYYPFDSTFHQLYPVSGVVEKADSRLLSSGDSGVSQRFVVKFRESETLFGCDDTRCALATPGKTVHLKCQKSWEFQATPGWVCRYDQAG